VPGQRADEFTLLVGEVGQKTKAPDDASGGRQRKPKDPSCWHAWRFTEIVITLALGAGFMAGWWFMR
jgi:hypothetical protein